MSRVVPVPPLLALPLVLLGCATAGGSGDDEGGANQPDSGGSVFADAAPRADAAPTVDAAPSVDAPPAAVDCTEDTTISCGDLLEHSLFLADETITHYSCQTVDTAGVENIYQFRPTADASVTFTLDVLDDEPIIGDDFDLYVLEDVCGVANCTAQSSELGDETLTFNATAGKTYYIVVEGFSLGLLTLRNYDLSLTCN